MQGYGGVDVFARQITQETSKTGLIFLNKCYIKLNQH